MATGKTVQLAKFGFGEDGKADLKVVNTPIPEPAEGEIVVRMKVCPVNPADIFSIMGVYPGFQPALMPAIPGLEGMGVVHAVGTGVTTFTPGQRVVPFVIYGSEMCAKGNGSWQEYLCINAEEVYAVPDSVSDEAASQFVVNPWTAFAMFQELAPPAGSWVMQTAAGSVLGRQFIQICKHFGVKTINIVRREAQADELKALGADVVLCSSTEADIPTRVKEITGGAGAYGAIDAVAGDLTATVTTSLRAGGHCLIYGAMSGLSFKGSVVDALFRGVVVRGFWITQWAAAHGLAACHALADKVWPLFTSGVVVPFSGTAYPVEEVVEAVKASMAEARGGKVLIKF